MISVHAYQFRSPSYQILLILVHYWQSSGADLLNGNFSVLCNIFWPSDCISRNSDGIQLSSLMVHDCRSYSGAPPRFKRDQPEMNECASGSATATPVSYHSAAGTPLTRWCRACLRARWPSASVARAARRQGRGAAWRGALRGRRLGATDVAVGVGRHGLAAQRNYGGTHRSTWAA